MITPLLGSKSTVRPLVVSLALVALSAAGAEWPQYHGPTGNRLSPEKFSKNWPAAGPKTLWKEPMNTGFSSITVAGGRAYTIVRRSIENTDMEVVVALNASTGKEQWAFTLDAAGNYEGGGESGAPGNDGGDGPRSTPSVDGNRVYAYSSKMKLVCIDATTGKQAWAVDVLKQHAGRNLRWLSAASPLIEGNLVYVPGGGPGKSLLAFNKATGALAWGVQDDPVTHSTPMAATIHGVRQIVFVTERGLVSLEPLTGKLLWRQAYPFSTSTASSPVVSGDMVYTSAAYQVGAGVYQVSKAGEVWTTKEVWRKPRELMNHWSTPVVQDGYLYGLFGHRDHANGPLQCIEVATGRVMWSKAGFGPGGVILADGHLVALQDDGHLVLVEATSKEYKEVARAKVLTGKCWSTPTLSNGHLFVRSSKEGVCLDVGGSLASR